MSGFVRDLGAVDPWDASLERSRARRARSHRTLARGRKAAGASQQVRPADPFGLGSLLRGELAPKTRDLATGDAWQLSLRRSRAPRPAAELRLLAHRPRGRPPS